MWIMYSLEHLQNLKPCKLDLNFALSSKFCRSSAKVYSFIPEHLSESKGLSISIEPHLENNALGVHWDVGNYNIYVSVPHLNFMQCPTKREITSSAAKVSNIFAWFSPSVVLVKILLQKSQILESVETKVTTNPEQGYPS